MFFFNHDNNQILSRDRLNLTVSIQSFHLSHGEKRRNLSRNFRTDADGRHPLENCRHILDDQMYEQNPITVWCTALQTALSGLSHIVFSNCRYSDEGIIAKFCINNRTFPELFRQIRFTFWIQSGLYRQSNPAMKNLSRSCPFHGNLWRTYTTVFRQ